MNVIQNLVVVIFLIATMLSMGLQTTPISILRAFSDRGLVVRSLLLNIVAVPLIGYVLYRLFNLQPTLAIGLIIVIAASGSPFGLKLTELAGGNIPYATALVICLSVIGIVTTPIVAQFLLPAGARAAFNTLSVIGQLILFSLVPLIVGLQIRRENPSSAQRFLPIVRRVSTISLVLVFIAVLAANQNKVAQLDAPTLIVITAISLLSLGLGWLLARNDLSTQKSLALNTGMRNFGLALLIANSSFPGTSAAATVVAFALISFIVCTLPTVFWNRQVTPIQPLVKNV